MTNSRTLIHGQKMHRDLTWNFSFWRPLNWHGARLDTPHGIVYYPEDDPQIGFYVIATDLGQTAGTITRDDMPALREGLIEGLQRLSDCEILSEQEITKEKAMGFEFLVTFTRQGAPYKQKLRVLYHKGRQYSIYGQGTPPEEYDVFENTFDYMYLTLRFGDLLLDMGVPPMPGMETRYIPPDN